MLFKRIASSFPGLGAKLVQAGIFKKPEDFVKASFTIAFYLTTALTLAIGGIISRFQLGAGVIFLFPILFVLTFFYLMKQPDILILKKQREIDSEIVYAARFLVIELQSGVPIYDAMVSVSKSYPVIGKYFREILNSIDIGTPIENALNETIELTPSQNFRKFLWQIFNSLKTGADLAVALSTTTDQIAEEQVITVKEYGRKLNPIIMFYMVIAVIFPSIGVIMLIIFSTFFGIKIGMIVLILIAAFVALFQLIFVSVIREQRPAIGL